MQNLFNTLTYRFLHGDNTYLQTYVDTIVAITLVVSFLVYLHRYPVFRVVLGILFLLSCSILSLLAGFSFTALIFGIASLLIFFSLPLIFAPEVRHYLEKLGRFPFLRLPHFTERQKKNIFIRNLVGAVFELAERHIGATIVITRKTGLGETIETGVIIDARFGSKLLQNLFFPKSPLHDGAVIIKDERIYAAGCLLPIHGSIKLDPPFGTRHKSGLSITGDTDAVVLLVSEQRSEVSLAENGKLFVNLSRIETSDKLTHLL